MFSKMLIYLFCVVGLFSFIFAAIPSEFFKAAYSAQIGEDKSVAERFVLANVTMYEQLGNDNMTFYYSSRESLDEWKATLPSNQRLDIVWTARYVAGFPISSHEGRHIQYSWWHWSIIDLVTWKHDGVTVSQRLTSADIISNYDEEINGTAFEGSCSHIQTSIIYAYNMTKYTSIEDSINHLELNYALSYEIDWNATSISAWTVLGQLITFQNPDLGIGGVGGGILNAVIALPFWCMTAILIIKIVQSIIPFIKGVDD